MIDAGVSTVRMILDINGDMIGLGDLVIFTRSTFEEDSSVVGIVLEVQDDHPIKFVRILASGADDWYRSPHEVRRVMR